MRRPCNERGGSEISELFKGKGVDLAENIRTQVGAEARHHLRGGLCSEQDAAETDGGDDQHLNAGAENGQKVSAADAAVQYV